MHNSPAQQKPAKSPAPFLVLQGIYRVCLLAGMWLFVISGKAYAQPEDIGANQPKPLIVRHIEDEAAGDPRNRYVLDLLDLVMRKSGVDYRLLPADKRMQQSRAIQMLERGELIDVVWSMTSTERESILLPIRIPLDKGMIGVRLCLIRAREQHRFDDVQTLQQLKALTAGQGHDWPDGDILRANGIQVINSPSYLSLFTMLKHRRFDFFPRTAEEIWAEQKKYGGDELSIEKRLVIHYPAASYFFVNKDNQRLANVLTAGFENAIDDGSFEALFQQYFHGVIASINNRTVIQLQNPLLPPATPVDKKAYWFVPFSRAVSP